jgi:hypothetical protein
MAQPWQMSAQAPRSAAKTQRSGHRVWQNSQGVNGLALVYLSVCLLGRWSLLAELGRSGASRQDNEFFLKGEQKCFGGSGASRQDNKFFLKIDKNCLGENS